MRVTLIRAKYYNNDEKRKLDFVLDALSAGINSVQFMEFMLNHQGFDTVDQLSNEAIYQLIMSGNEKDSEDGADEEADLDLVMDGSISADAVGYTKRGKIYTHRNKFHDKTISELSGHFAHEYCHLLDFDDPTQTGPEFNVPYEVGRIIKELAESTQRTFLPETRVALTKRKLRSTKINFEKTTILTVRKTSSKRREKSTPKKTVKKKSASRRKPTKTKKRLKIPT